MPNDCVTYQNSGYFSKLITDYLDEKSELQSLYNRFPKIEHFQGQIDEKSNNFPFENRQILVSALEKQYENFKISEYTSQNIQLLKQSNTFTITTGHQLNLFSGPLYFLYKIVSTINLCKELKLKFPAQNFVPIYWMATEDHDFEEINYFNFKGKKISWNKESKGAVGRFDTKGLDVVYNSFSEEIVTGNNANYLLDLFKKSYFEHQNLADATRFLANELFKNEGLVIIDGDSNELKKLFVPYIKRELVEQISYQKVTETLPKLSDYTIQVNPREINLFYLQDKLRERIIFENGNYKIYNTSLVFSESEIITELEKNPENFSPNVILRPLYQEVILPNLCYIGGGGEIAYWLELKSNFESNKVTFPMLLVRNSVLLATEKQVMKLDKLGLSWNEIFMSQELLSNKKVKEFSNFTIDFSEQKEVLKQQFKALHEIALKTDKSFIGAVKAQEAKQLKGLDNLEKRLLKAEKRVHSETVNRIVSLQNELFPNNNLQERNVNFSEYYFEFGTKLMEELLCELNPLSQEFKIITL
jgi:bacillithiol biosynthesis cysteine-adding enzyme BshC